MSYKEFEIDLSDHDAKELIGAFDSNLQYLEELFNCNLVFRNNTFKYEGSDPEGFQSFLKILTDLIDKGITIDTGLIRKLYKSHVREEDLSWRDRQVGLTAGGKPIFCKTYNQQLLIETIKQNPLTFSIGPAGTGKTFLSVMMAVKAFKRGDVEKIVLTRPAVEAGESLGFLPGDLKEKIDPYLMPLYDSLDALMGKETVEKLLETGSIEIMPLAYMRGRTLDKCFVILDEAQNTTAGQMLMFLTRLGNSAKMVVNGDITQIDLNLRREESGLVRALNTLQNVEGIGFLEFESSDVVRHPLVEKIIKLYSNE